MDSGTNIPPHGGSTSTSGARWRRRLLAVTVATVALVAAGPTLVAWSPLRHELPKTRMRGFRGRIHVGSATLSWFGPAVLRDVQFFDPEGNCFLETRVSEDDRSLLTRILHPSRRPHLRIERPVITLKLRAGGSNVEDALRPVIEYEGKRAAKATELTSTDGIMTVIDTQTGKSTEWREINLSILNPVDQKADHALDLSAVPAAGPEKEPFTLHVTFNDLESGEPLEAQITAKSQAIPLESLVPFLGRMPLGHALTNLSAGGTSSCDIQAHVHRAPREPLAVLAKGQVGSSHVDLSWPGRLSDEHLSLEKSTLDFEVDIADEMCEIRRLDWASDIGTWNGHGKVSLKERAVDTRSPFGGKGSIDLAQLTSMIPRTLGIPDNMAIISGKLELAVSGQQGVDDLESLHWNIEAQAPRIEARVDSQPVVWKSPVSLAVDIVQSPQQWRLDGLECVTPVLTLHGKPAGDALRITGAGDIEQVLQRLGTTLDPRSTELRGQFTLTGDVRQPEGGAVDIQGEIVLNDLKYSRLVTRMNEVRRGDLDQRDAPPPPQPAPQPALKPLPVPRGLPRAAAERRAQREMARAERAARREALRAEREANREANETVLVPVDEWQTLWNDPRLVLSGSYRVVWRDRVLKIESAGLETEGLKIGSGGEVSQLLAGNDLTLQGQIDVNLEQLMAHVPALGDQPARLVGNQQIGFEFQGPAREVSGRMTGGWQQANAFGLAAGPVQWEMQIARGQATVPPTELDLSGGRMILAGGLDLTTSPPVFSRSAGPFLQNVQLTQEICNGWLQYLAPVLSQATRSEGTFSLELDETRLPLGELKDAQLAGRLEIPYAQVLPGPLFDQLGTLIASIESGVRGGGIPRDLLGLDKPLMTLENQAVDFQLHEGRLHHSPILVQTRKVAVEVSGSVGLDKSLDLLAVLVFPPEWSSRLPFLNGPDGRGLEIPIGGTLGKPRPERGSIARVFEQLGTGALEDLLNGQLLRIFNR